MSIVLEGWNWVWGFLQILVLVLILNYCTVVLAGDTQIVSFPQLGHYDFASSLCSGNEESLAKESTNNDKNINSIAQALVTAVYLSHWPGATPRALSYTDNEKLTPGHNDSKPYPGNIRVHFTKLPIPDTTPQVCICSWPYNLNFVGCW